MNNSSQKIESLSTASSVWNIRNDFNQWNYHLWNLERSIYIQSCSRKIFHFMNWREKVINISSKKWMSINLKQNAKIAVIRVYSIESKEKEIIDQEFDKLHAQKRMQYFSHSIAHDYSVFVTWRTILKLEQISMKKRRVIVDIRTLNKIIETDIYFMSLQSDIISSIVDCDFIFIVDATIFFHQWMIKLENRHKFIVITHKEQKQFNVEVMSFKNTSSYVQQKIDNILREFKTFCKVYINDIIIFSKTLQTHIQHFHLIFDLFTNLNINLFSIKSFLDYSTIQLLKLKVDAFELSTSKEKLKVIASLKFFKLLQDLKIYLEFTEWFRNYIFFFAQKSKSLQIKKTTLLRFSFTKEHSRKTFFRQKNIDDIIESKQNSYDQIQKVFARIFFLIYFDHTRFLYIDINAFKRWKFDVMIYHNRSNFNYSSEKYSKKFDIQSVLFLSRLLINFETRYWLIELKMIELMWVVKRIRHMIKSAKRITVIFTNHVANAFIVKQTTLNSDNIDKLNLRFVRVSAYFSQFDIDVKYKADKINIVSNALSRFLSINAFRDFVRMNTFDIDSYHEAIENISMNNHAF